MKKIIVPTDFSEQAGYALDLAAEIAASQQAEITLVHVVDIPKPASGFLGSSSIDTGATLSSGDQMEQIFTLKLIEKSEQRLNELVNDPRYSGVKLDARLLKGTPYQEIGEVITQVKADLIIMGTSGVSNWAESLIGSTAEKVVRHAGCPVMTLRLPVKVANINKIVLASDFKEDFGRYQALPAAISETFQASLHLAYINTPGHFLNEREIMVRVGDFIDSKKLKNAEKHIYCHQNAGEGIIAFAEDYKMDVIVMATSGERSGIFKLFDHSIAEDVVNHSKKPVITFNLHK